jgi:ankyrin repeat protein
MKHIKTFEVLKGASMLAAFAEDLKFLTNGYNKLMVAIFNNDYLDFKKLVSITNLEEVDKEGNTALLIASNYGRTKMLKELIKHGASITHENNEGEDFYDVSVNRFKFINGVKDWIEKEYPEFITAKKYNL